MTETAILLPVLAQVFLTLMLFILLLLRKKEAMQSGTVNSEETALDNRKWPSAVVKVSNNIANQFETPMLFYVLCLILFGLNVVSSAIIYLAWVYVVTRYVHAYVHVTSNFVPFRMKAFALGVLILLCMTVITAIHIASTS
ncbi:MAPEG family protein [Litoribacillus peritrichatus]|uniref:MAPEG family protein n=1 Tax=Litoribacillus peritrichatus TaxID=718191 RepID=A0ABP7MFD5_9GAMM